jgi:hypothetical protein
MARRKTPRTPEDALAISRALRKRYISPEAEKTAKRLLAEQIERQAEPQEKPFTDSERRKAATILENIKRRYSTKH